MRYILDVIASVTASKSPNAFRQTPDKVLKNGDVINLDIAARGHGWASYLTDRKTGTVTVGIPFDVSLSPTYGADVRVAGDLVWSEKTIPILKGKVPLAGHCRPFRPASTSPSG